MERPVTKRITARRATNSFLKLALRRNKFDKSSIGPITMKASTATGGNTFKKLLPINAFEVEQTDMKKAANSIRKMGAIIAITVPVL
jgi:mannose-6-phosphate isomerase class I